MTSPRPKASEVEQPDASRRNHWIGQLERHALMQPEAIAVSFQGTRMSWTDLRFRVERLAGALHRRGVARGDRVAVLMTNRPEFLECLLAASWLGAVGVPINFRLMGPEVSHLLSDSGATVLIGEEATLQLCMDATQDRESPFLIVIHEGESETFSAYEVLMNESGPPAPVADVREDSPALIMYTSGTTGRPKGAVLTYSNLQAQALTIIRSFRWCGDDEVNLIASPMFHIGALGSIIPCMLIGARLVILPTGNFEARTLLDVIEEEEVTTLFLVPTQWQAVCEDSTLSSRNLERLRIVSWGAAPASDQLLRRMSAAFPSASIVALFGQTEMSPVTCVLDGADALRKLGSVGRPVPTVTARIVDAAMNEVAPGHVGEIVYRGPSLMLGYWQNPAATAEAFAGGWFHSGDLVKRDAEGFIYVVDRLKDMIISGGENVYCAEVESVLAEHPRIAEVSVIGRPHGVWGETPIAVLVTTDGGDLSPNELKEWASSRMAKYKVPSDTEVVGELPRNASGKVNKQQLRHLFRQGRPTARRQ